MTRDEYDKIQGFLTRKMQTCSGLTGKRKEGYEQAVLELKSKIHEIYNHAEPKKCDSFSTNPATTPYLLFNYF